MDVMIPPNLWFQDLVCKAVRDLGGTSGRDAIHARAIELGQFSEEQLALEVDGDAQSRVHAEIVIALARAVAEERLLMTADGTWATPA